MQKILFKNSGYFERFLLKPFNRAGINIRQIRQVIKSLLSTLRRRLHLICFQLGFNYILHSFDTSESQLELNSIPFIYIDFSPLKGASQSGESDEIFRRVTKLSPTENFTGSISRGEGCFFHKIRYFPLKCSPWALFNISSYSKVTFTQTSVYSIFGHSFSDDITLGHQSLVEQQKAFKQTIFATIILVVS